MNRTNGGDAPYQPISCDIYSRLELAILRRQRLRLVWHDANVCFIRTVIPFDLETRTGQEFLHYRVVAGKPGRIRLDRIDRLGPA